MPDLIDQIVTGTKGVILKTIMHKSGWEVAELVPVFKDIVLRIKGEGGENKKLKEKPKTE